MSWFKNKKDHNHKNNDEQSLKFHPLIDIFEIKRLTYNIDLDIFNKYVDSINISMKHVAKNGYKGFEFNYGFHEKEKNTVKLLKYYYRKAGYYVKIKKYRHNYHKIYHLLIYWI